MIFSESEEEEMDMEEEHQAQREAEFFLEVMSFLSRTPVQGGAVDDEVWNMNAVLGEISEGDLEELYEVNAVEYEYYEEQGMQDAPGTEIDAAKVVVEQVRKNRVFWMILLLTMTIGYFMKLVIDDVMLNGVKTVAAKLKSALCCKRREVQALKEDAMKLSVTHEAETKGDPGEEEGFPRLSRGT